MGKIIANSPKQIVPIVQSIFEYIEDEKHELHLKGFEDFEDLSVVGEVRSLKLSVNDQVYHLKLQHVIRENGDSLYISSNARNLIQYVFKTYTNFNNNRVLLYHDGRINGIANLRNLDTINALNQSELSNLIKDKKIILGDFELPLTRDSINQFLSNIIRYAIFRRQFGDNFDKSLTFDKPNKNYWLYQPGRKANHWRKFQNENVIGLGWDNLGDLRSYENKDNLVNKLKSISQTNSSKKNDATANWDFYHTMQVGDIVIVKKGRRTLLGYGEIISDYLYDPNRQEYTSIRQVKWMKTGEWTVSFDLVLKTLTNITKYESEISEGKKYYDYLISIMNENNSKIKTLTLRNSRQSMAKNQILYGPPGTGKTYNTINKAVSIANPSFDLSQNRVIIKAEYQRLVESGQIVFTTFHQSMSYEDFIEGIKPLKPLPNDTYVKYEVVSGIFKNICRDAETNIELSKIENKSKRPFDEVFEELKLELEDTPDLKFPLKTAGYDFTILGFTNTSIQFKKASGGTGHTLSLKTLEELYYGKEYDFKGGVGIYYPSILQKLNSYNEKNQGYKEECHVKIKPHILIVDEINRGNVSAIFGELITLIEESKRSGSEESLEVILPYSKEKFSVPPNLYIIGTMNTADRSVETLDTALRRRFVFEEMLPDPNLKELDYEVFGYKASAILKRINLRIEKLVDRDHCIGHAYFIGKNEETIIDSFYKNIIPLLQEYFFGDYGKIGLVLGKGFIRLKQSESALFADFSYEYKEDLESRTVYEIIDYRNGEIDTEGFGKAISALMNNG